MCNVYPNIFVHMRIGLSVRSDLLCDKIDSVVLH